MATPSVQLKGQKAVDNFLAKVSNPTKLLDGTVRQTALLSIGPLVEASQTKKPKTQTFDYGGKPVTANRLNSGDTARAWTAPKRLAPAKYLVSNTKQTDDRKHNIVDIIDQGTRSDIRPRRAKALYIPLTAKGKRRRKGAKPSGEFGIDYIYVKKIKKRKGSGFLKKVAAESSRLLTRLTINKIKLEVSRK